MPKIPTFTAQGSIEQLAGTTSRIKMGLDQNLASALAPATKAIVDVRSKQKDFENKTEALRLENDFVRDMQSVYDEVNVLENEEIAQSIVKEKSNSLINKYSSLASNNNSRTLFTNNALSEVQKGIFRTSTQVAANTLTSLDNQVNTKRERLLTTAFLAEGGFDYSVLETDLKNLYTNNYAGKISNADLNKVLASIPGQIKTYEASKLITDDPKLAYTKLKNENEFVGIPLKTRISLISEAEGILRPQMEKSFQNFLDGAALGKNIPFDMKFAKEIFDEKIIIKMEEQYKAITTTLDNVKTLNTIPNSDVSETIENLINSIDQEVLNESKTVKEGEAQKKILLDAVTKRNSAMSSDPVNFLTQTNDNIRTLVDELNAETNNELRLEKKIALTDIYVQTQKDMGQQPYKIKVMSKNEAENFVEQYVNGNAEMRVAMLQNLDAEFGQYNSNAMLELSNAGLPVTAELSSFFANPRLTKKFLSFDSKDEQNRLKNFAKDNKIDFSVLRAAVRDNIQDFEDVAVMGSRFNNSVAAEKIDNIVEVLSYYTLNEMFAGNLSESKAQKNATNLINDAFVIEETYFVPKMYNGKDISSSIEADGGIVDKTNLIKDYYLDLFNAVAFESGDETVTDVALTEEMRDQMTNFGEWRNTADGTGLIYGIVFNDGSFAPVKNKDENYLSFDFNDTTLILPGTNIEMNLNIDEPQKTKIDDQSASLMLDENMQPTLVGLNDTTGDLNFVTKIWSPYYQTGGKKNTNLKKEANAYNKLKKKYTVPSDAKKAIDIASNIFEGQNTIDGRLSKKILTNYLSKIGQIETEYKYKKQKGDYIEETEFLARSYWQVEPATAESLIKENMKTDNPMFGPKFEKFFRKKYPEGKSVLAYLNTRSKKQLADILFEDVNLAAVFAGAKLVTELMTV